MTNISQITRDFLNKNPFIIKGLNEGIINTRALSYYILRKTKTDATVHAATSAIRRYQKENPSHKEKIQKVRSIYKDSRISTKSHLLIITVKRHFRYLKNFLPKILANIHISKGEVLRTAHSRESIKFVIDHAKEKEILPLIPKEEITHIEEDVGEIIINFSEKYGDRPGLIVPLLNELAINDINILGIIASMPEIVILVKEKKISQCHDILLKFLYGDTNAD